MGATIAVLDELDKLDPTTGTVVPAPRTGAAYLAANHVWDAARGEITLTAARNEFVGFQVAALGNLSLIATSFGWNEPPGAARLTATLHRLPLVATPRGPMPDPVVPFIMTTPGTPSNQTYYCEVYVPHDAAVGVHEGRLTLMANDGMLKLPIRLRVLDFTLPDTLGFLPELNAYGLPDPERDYYRLAHRHRSNVNRVPYSQRGVVAPGMAPALAEGRLDWTAWDARFGPLLDGSAFADLPRSGVPVDSFYLPIHENWPTPIEPNYHGGYWADSAFTPGYRQAFVDVSRQFAAHLDDRGWESNGLRGFLNNKRDFKAGDALGGRVVPLGPR